MSISKSMTKEYLHEELTRRALNELDKYGYASETLYNDKFIAEGTGSFSSAAHENKKLTTDEQRAQYADHAKFYNKLGLEDGVDHTVSHADHVVYTIGYTHAKKVSSLTKKLEGEGFEHKATKERNGTTEHTFEHPNGRLARIGIDAKHPEDTEVVVKSPLAKNAPTGRKRRSPSQVARDNYVAYD